MQSFCDDPQLKLINKHTNMLAFCNESHIKGSLEPPGIMLKEGLKPSLTREFESGEHEISMMVGQPAMTTMMVDRGSSCFHDKLTPLDNWSRPGQINCV